MNIKALKQIRHNGKSYKKGEVVTGLSKKEYDRLVILKAGVEVEGQEVSEDDFDQDEYENILTVEGFRELKADDQKRHLKSLEIEPAGNEDGRIQQYEDWFTEQVTAE